MMSEPLTKQESQTSEPIKQEESRSNSNRNTPAPQTGLQFEIPSTLANAKPEDIIGGAPVRQWLNKQITPFLLDGLRKVSKERPEDPLRTLGEYLIQQSQQQNK